MQRPVAPTQRDHNELMAAKINRARQIERRSDAARRRLTLLTVQFAVGMVLVTAGAVSLLSWWWALITLVTIAGTLLLGAQAAKVGRENDQRAQERIRALETPPAKGHRVSASEKKFAQMQAESNLTAHSDSAEESETNVQEAAGELEEQAASENLGQQVLGKLAAAARRAATLREYFVIHEDEAENQTKERPEAEASGHTRESNVDDSPRQIEVNAESATTVAAEDEDTVSADEQVNELSVDVTATEVITADIDEDATDEADSPEVSDRGKAEAEDSAGAHHSWAPTPMPKPTYALKPRLARRDVDASELLAEHLAARGSTPYRPSRPLPHTEESLTTAQLVAQSKPVDVEAILNSRRVAN